MTQGIPEMLMETSALLNTLDAKFAKPLSAALAALCIFHYVLHDQSQPDWSFTVLKLRVETSSPLIHPQERAIVSLITHPTFG